MSLNLTFFSFHFVKIFLNFNSLGLMSSSFREKWLPLLNPEPLNWLHTSVDNFNNISLGNFFCKKVLFAVFTNFEFGFSFCLV